MAQERVRGPAAVPRFVADLPVGDLVLEDDGALEHVEATGGEAPDEVADVFVRGCRLVGVAFTGAVLRSAELEDVVLVDCELSGSTWEQARFRRVRFERCRMAGFTASELEAEDVAFVDCKLDGAWFRMARLRHCAVEGCDLTGSDLYESTVTSSSIVHSTLDASELTGARFEDVALHGTSLRDITGAASLRNVVIGPDQVIDVALPVFAALGIRIEEEPDESADRDG